MHIFIICTNTISDANRCVTPRGISYQDLQALNYCSLSPYHCSLKHLITVPYALNYCSLTLNYCSLNTDA